MKDPPLDFQDRKLDARSLNYVELLLERSSKLGQVTHCHPIKEHSQDASVRKSP
jgi:hypothetical protein